MKIIKRNGAEEIFNEDKILIAITKANESVPEDVRMTRMIAKVNICVTLNEVEGS